MHVCEAPSAYLDARGRRGRESSYFEWIGAGLYATDRRGASMHGRQYLFWEYFHYGFGSEHLWLRVDLIAEAIAKMPEFQLRLTVWDSRETRITLRVEEGKLAGCVLEHDGVCLLRPQSVVSAAYGTTGWR